MKIERILAGVDFSSASIRAARWAAQHFDAGTELVIAHIIDVPRVPSFLEADLPDRDTAIAAAREDATRRLDELVADLPRPVRTVIEVGPAHELLARIAKDVDADLIVVGEHGIGLALRDALGTTAERLLHEADRPVLVARDAGAGGPSMILAPIDVSPEADPVLAWAGALAARFNAELALFHNVDSSLTGRVRLVSASGAARAFEERLRKSTEAWLHERARQAGLPPERTLALVSVGDTRGEVLAVAERVKPDLIVMGSHGAGVAGRLLGSVARTVLRHARCPVLILPRGAV